MGSAVMGPAAPVVAQAAAPTPRAAAAPGAGATAAPGADITAGGDWGALRGRALGDALGRRLALLLVLLAGHLGGQVQELRERDSRSDQHTETSLSLPDFSTSFLTCMFKQLASVIILMSYQLFS